MYIGLHVKYPLFLSVFKELNFLDRFSKKHLNMKFDEYPFSGAEFFHADGWTDKRTLRS